MRKIINIILVGIVAFLSLGLLAIYLFPWNKIDWGRIGLLQGDIVVVSGTAEQKKRNEIARFTAGMNVVNDDKDKAIKEVNEVVEKIIVAAKSFGIKEEDIKTQNLSIYQEDESLRDGVKSSGSSGKGQWRVSNNVEIILREVDRASALAEVLTQQGANNIYGPMLGLDNSRQAEDELLAEAMGNAKKKAEVMAKAAGKKLGDVTSVIESSSPVYAVREAAVSGLGGGMPIEPGSTTVSKTVVVTFRLD